MCQWALELFPGVISVQRQFDHRSPLDEIVQKGARRMLQSATGTAAFSGGRRTIVYDRVQFGGQ
ncbi:hypothetical protein Q31a_36140 [Aureliella helgolandensis]|uniref:Uncharacterized protein n=1 Tax=Aureliella helgolandensis TaxID=2527968 RepID=A0A518G9P5_9BACT|nr:hypothetical protein Q31a_36140 [Aureliella helgolandensis]